MKNDLHPILTASLFLFISLPCFAGQLYTDFPKDVDSTQHYVFYSHGYIVEGNNQKPVHPRFGIYDFPAIKQALSSSKFNLIAYHRPKNTQPKLFSKKLANDVKKLIKMNVPAKNITLLGFSRGGFITALASSRLSSENFATSLNTILMASCGEWINQMPQIKLSGSVLSIYETSDSFSSCQLLIKQSPNVVSFKEVAITTGKQHGAFFSPRKQWLNPVIDWINRHSK
jgi:hypothetical protein